MYLNMSKLDGDKLLAFITIQFYIEIVALSNLSFHSKKRHRHEVGPVGSQVGPVGRQVGPVGRQIGPVGRLLLYSISNLCWVPAVHDCDGTCYKHIGPIGLLPCTTAMGRATSISGLLGSCRARLRWDVTQSPYYMCLELIVTRCFSHVLNEKL